MPPMCPVCDATYVPGLHRAAARRASRRRTTCAELRRLARRAACADPGRIRKDVRGVLGPTAPAAGGFGVNRPPAGGTPGERRGKTSGHRLGSG